MQNADDPNHKLNVIINTMTENKIQLLGIAETHWSIETENLFELNIYAVIHSGRTDGTKRQGVAFVTEKQLSNSTLDYELVSERLIILTLKVQFILYCILTITIFQVYAPDSSYSEEYNNSFYNLLQSKLDKCSKTQKLIIMGDFNAKVGNNHHTTIPGVIGNYGLGECNDRGWNLLQFCAFNNLFIGNTVFKHKKLRKITWTSPDQKTSNQIDKNGKVLLKIAGHTIPLTLVQTTQQ